MTRDIPFVAKRSDGPEPWAIFGCDRESYEKWAPHICGVAAARSLILAKQGKAPSLWELTELAVGLGVYVEEQEGIVGAFHEPLIELLQRFGLAASRFGRLQDDDLKALVEGGPVILSIDLTRIDRSLRGSHFVVVTEISPHGYRVLDNAQVLHTHGEGRILSPTELNAISNGKGIAIDWWI